MSSCIRCCVRFLERTKMKSPVTVFRFRFGGSANRSHHRQSTPNNFSIGELSQGLMPCVRFSPAAAHRKALWKRERACLAEELLEEAFRPKVSHPELRLCPFRKRRAAACSSSGGLHDEMSHFQQRGNKKIYFRDFVKKSRFWKQKSEVHVSEAFG